LHEIVEMVRRASGHDLEVRVNQSFVRANEVNVLVGSAAKLRHLLPQTRSIDFVDTIEWMVRRGSSAADPHAYASNEPVPPQAH
jgi:GDP-D-mannose dehydratase